MRILVWIMRLFIPFIVLYTIGYLVPGFSALTIPWIAFLAVLITLSEWLAIKVFRKRISRVGGLIIDFLLAAFIIFTVTLTIESGSVPFGGALLAAAIIAGLNLILIKPRIIMNR
jgi:hypothetical protein